jgi:hypothetical protein
MKSSFYENLDKLYEFIPKAQYEALKEIHRGPEKDSAKEITQRLAETIESMPGPYGTEGTARPEKMVYLHYFQGGSDFYILERDNLPGRQYQAFGYTILNGDLENAEFGYIDIFGLIELGVELDFYFKPVKFKEL